MENNIIKPFRAQTKNKKWLYGWFNPPNHMFIDGNLKNPIIKETLGRYSFKKDINNIPIYSGDIVKKSNGILGIIVFDKSISAWCVEEQSGNCSKAPFFLNSNTKLEIIGNTFDNPELINKG